MKSVSNLDKEMKEFWFNSDNSSIKIECSAESARSYYVSLLLYDNLDFFVCSIHSMLILYFNDSYFWIY